MEKPRLNRGELNVYGWNRPHHGEDPVELILKSAKTFVDSLQYTPLVLSSAVETAEGNAVPFRYIRNEIDSYSTYNLCVHLKVEPRAGKVGPDTIVNQRDVDRIYELQNSAIQLLAADFRRHGYFVETEPNIGLSDIIAYPFRLAAYQASRLFDRSR